MNSNTKTLLESLPDFSEFMSVTEEIGKLLYTKLLLEKEIKKLEANVVTEAMVNEKYFIGGKPASMSYIESTLKFTGLDGEIVPLREELARVTGKLEESKLKLYVYKDMLEVWRTLSANERNSGL